VWPLHLATAFVLLDRNTKSFSGMNDAQCRPAWQTFCLAPVSKRVGSRTSDNARW